MKQMRKKLFGLVALLSATGLIADCNSTNSGSSSVLTTFVPRSQGRDKTVQVVGVTEYTHLYGMCSNGWGELSITPEYTQSFRPRNITSAFFGPFLVNNNNNNTTNTTTNNCNKDCGSSQTLLIQGVSVPNRNAQALIADNFYLPPDFSSQVSFSPRIRNGLVNFDLYIGLDGICSGLYARFYGPFVHTKWNLNFCENIVTPGTAFVPAGFLAETDVARGSLLTSFAAYAQGTAPAPTRGNGNFDGGIVGSALQPVAIAAGQATIFDGLRYSRMLSGGKSANGFADLYAELGWDFWACDDYHLGIDALLAFPTGQQGSTCLMFSPRIGDDKWQLGGGVTGHYIFWRSDCDDFNVGFYLDANITHVFKRTEYRVFDLKNNAGTSLPLSRYLLAERFGANVRTLQGSTTAPTFGPPPVAPVAPTAAGTEFAYEFSPVANLTQRAVKVSYGVQADIVAWFNFAYCGWSWDIGYNFWGRSREKISAPTNNSNTNNTSSSCNSSCGDCISFQFNSTDAQWGLKGSAQVIGYLDTLVAGTPPTINPAIPPVPIALSATQSNATINCPITNPVTGNGTPSTVNGGGAIDNGQFAFSGALPLAANVSVPLIPIQTSIQPVLLTESNIDYSARNRGISHKVFTHLSFNFDCECWMPFLGIGGFAEFGNHSCNAAATCPTTPATTTSTTNNSCNSSNSIRSALSQWGVWVKGGVAFN